MITASAIENQRAIEAYASELVARASTLLERARLIATDHSGVAAGLTKLAAIELHQRLTLDRPSKLLSLTTRKATDDLADNEVRAINDGITERGVNAAVEAIAMMLLDKLLRIQDRVCAFSDCDLGAESAARCEMVGRGEL